MRRLFLCLSVASLSGLAALAQTAPAAKQLSADDMKKILDGKTKVFWLDVREPKEIEETGSVKGYVNIPLGDLEKRMAEIPKDAQVVTL